MFTIQIAQVTNSHINQLNGWSDLQFVEHLCLINTDKNCYLIWILWFVKYDTDTLLVGKTTFLLGVPKCIVISRTLTTKIDQKISCCHNNLFFSNKNSLITIVENRKNKRTTKKFYLNLRNRLFNLNFPFQSKNTFRPNKNLFKYKKSRF